MKQNFFIQSIRIFILVFVITILSSFAVFANVDSYDEKNGIVELYSGISDANDKFYMVKNCSGFIVSNSDSGCYIVTTYSGIDVSSKEKADCLKENNLNKDSFGYNETVKVVVNGDVSSAVSVCAKSKKENFVILQAESVINEKETLKLGNTVEKDEKVYSLGFANTSSDNYMRYNKDDVINCSGIVLDNNIQFSSGNYIKHTAYIEDGCSGGPLVNEDGYVVGLNDLSLSSDNYYALNIDSIKTILDNYSIAYTSYDYDQVYDEYQKLYNKCVDLSETGDYTYETVEKLKKSIEEVKTNITENSSIVELNSAIRTLKTAKAQLIKNTSVFSIIIYILIGVLIVLVTWLVYLLVLNWKRTHKNIRDNITESELETQSEKQEIAVNHVFNREKLPRVCFLRQINNNYVIRIEKSEYVLGSKREESDFVINNKAVSRKHATIRRIDDKFYLFDNNSVNGTYVNDVIIEDEGRMLKDGDIIALANEEFLFEDKQV